MKVGSKVYLTDETMDFYRRESFNLHRIPGEDKINSKNMEEYKQSLNLSEAYVRGEVIRVFSKGISQVLFENGYKAYFNNHELFLLKQRVDLTLL